jgi:alginate O-acetyltransferase complex protein AlgI
MIFTDLRFIALFVACWITFFLLPRAWRPAVLAFWGAAFYLLFAGPFAAVVVMLAALTFFSGIRPIAWIAGVTIVALLATFKLGLAPATVLVPLGFSYLAFELLHVIIERRRGRIQELSPQELLAFVFFAPARIAGPIKRFPQFSAAVRDAVPSAANVYAGLLRVFIGLGKKLLIADVLALTVAEKFYVASTRHAWIIVLAYSFQIYFDFSAYSDIAIGFARMLGITLPENFNWPYLARNIRDFWDRWHITLSRWVRDYIFLPAGRALFKTPLRPWPAAIAALSYLLTFLTVGAWHGLTASFLVWGLYHGALLALYHVVRLKMPLRIADHPWYRSRVADAIGIAITFACVTIGWVPFMQPLRQAGKMFALMFGAGK